MGSEKIAGDTNSLSARKLQETYMKLKIVFNEKLKGVRYYCTVEIIFIFIFKFRINQLFLLLSNIFQFLIKYLTIKTIVYFIADIISVYQLRYLCNGVQYTLYTSTKAYIYNVYNRYIHCVLQGIYEKKSQKYVIIKFPKFKFKK